MDGAGAGASISPIAFLVIQNGVAKLLPIDHTSCVDRLLDYVPDLMEKINCMFNKKIQNQNEKTEKIIEHIRKTAKESQNRDDFKEKNFEEKTSDKFNLKDDDSTDVKEEINYKIKMENENSDGEDF